MADAGLRWCPARGSRPAFLLLSFCNARGVLLHECSLPAARQWLRHQPVAQLWLGMAAGKSRQGHLTGCTAGRRECASGKGLRIAEPFL